MNILPLLWVWRPFFPPAAIGAVAGLCVLLALWLYARESLSWVRRAAFLGLRLAVLAAVALVLMGPSDYPPAAAAAPADLGECLVAVDVSGSMQTCDVAGPDGKPETRLSRALRTWGSDAVAKALDGQCRVRAVGLGEGAVQGDPAKAAPAPSSPLDRVLSAQIAELPANAGSCVVLASDGHESETGGSPFARSIALARERKIPVHTVCVGTRRLARDVAVEVAARQPYFIAGETGELVVRVSQTGADQERVRAQVTGPGGFSAQRELAFDGKPEVVWSVPVKLAARGAFAFEASVSAVPGEVEARNNKQSCFVEVVDRRLRVLVLEGQPHWDTKFLAQALRRDDGVELAEVACIGNRPEVRLSSHAPADAPPVAIPDNEDAFARYDVVILGAQVERLLTAQNAEGLTRAVMRHGVRAVLARGRPAGTANLPQSRDVAAALAPLEPVVWDEAGTRAGGGAGARWEPEPAQADHGLVACIAPAVWPLLPPLSRVEGVLREKETALVIARNGANAGGAPLLVAMPCAAGQVVAVCGEGMWRWSLAAAGRRELAGVYDRFWSDMVRHLAMGSGFKPGEDVALHLSRGVVGRGEAVVAEVSTRRAAALEGAQLTLAGPPGDGAKPAGEAQKLALTPVDSGQLRLHATVVPEDPGVYTVRLARPGHAPEEARFVVSAVDGERLRCDADPGAMRHLAEATSGRVLDGAGPADLAKLIGAQREAVAIPPQAEYVWGRLPILLLILGVAGVEWILRRKGGLA